MRASWLELGTKISSYQQPHPASDLSSARQLADTCVVAPTARMKRKNEAPVQGKSKKRAISDDEAQKNFREGLFESAVLQDYTKAYAASQPYASR